MENLTNGQDLCKGKTITKPNFFKILHLVSFSKHYIKGRQPHPTRGPKTNFARYGRPFTPVVVYDVVKTWEFMDF